MSQRILQKRRRTGIIVFAVILSIVLYLAGVFSGLYANKIFTEETKNNIFLFREETKQDLDLIENYLSFIDDDLKSLQLEQTFIESLTEKEKCEFSRISINELIKQFKFYWDRLPSRLEEYEKNNEKLPEEYLLLKEQYAHLSIRTWILAKNLQSKCNIDLIHGLYFYSADCKDCVKFLSVISTAKTPLPPENLSAHVIPGIWPV